MKVTVFSLADNTQFLTISAIAQKILSAIFFFVVSSVVGGEQTAAYFNIFAAIAIFTVVADFGLNNVLTREVAREPGLATTIFSTLLFSKIFFGCSAVGLLLVSKWFLQYPGGSWTLTVVAAITLVSDSFRALCYALLRAYKNVTYEAWGLVIAQFSILIVGLVALVTTHSLLILVGVFAVTSLAHSAYAAWCVRQSNGGGWPPLVFNASIVRNLLREATPFALAAIIAQIYSYQDAFLIHRFLPLAMGGDWARAYKLVYAFQFIPIALGASLYPVMSSLHNTQEVVRVFKKAYEYLLLIASPIMVGIYLVAAPLGARFAPSFVPSVPALSVLIWSLGFGFLWYVHGALLNGFRRQRLQTVVMAGACASSIMLNMYMIPHFGIVGAATTALISNALLWALGYCVISRLVHLPHWVLLMQTLKILAAAAGMGLVLYGLLCYHVTVLLVVPIGGIVYGIGLYIFGALSQDMRVSLLRKIPSRFIFWRSTAV